MSNRKKEDMQRTVRGKNVPELRGKQKHQHRHWFLHTSLLCDIQALSELVYGHGRRNTIVCGAGIDWGFLGSENILKSYPITWIEIDTCQNSSKHTFGFYKRKRMEVMQEVWQGLFICWGNGNKYHLLGRLDSRHLFSRFWKPEVQGPRVAWAGFSLAPFPVSSPGPGIPLCVSLPQSPVLERTFVINLEPCRWLQVALTTSSRSHLQSQAHAGGGGLWLQQRNFNGSTRNTE